MAETVTNAPEPERTGPEAEQTSPEAEQTPEKWDGQNAKRSRKWFHCLLTTNFTEQDTGADLATAAAFAAGGIVHTPGLELEAGPGELIVPADKLRRVLSASNADDLVAAYMAQEDEDAPASWTGTENRPPGACIGGRTPFSGKYYYYVWFEEPPTEGKVHE